VTGATSGELSAGAILELIESGAYPRDVIATIARGFLPLGQEDLISVLAYLAAYRDEEIAGFARASLSEIPTRIVHAFAANENMDAASLVRLMDATQDNFVLEALIRNRAVPDDAVAHVAARAEGPLQEVIVINQARILRAPEILDALLANPALTAETRRRALETREEFFEKKARLKELEATMEPELVDAPLDAIADLLARAVEQQPEEKGTLQPLTASEKLDPHKAAVWAKLSYLSVGEKVQLAFRGDRMIRLLLVRDRNRLICSAVMRNPRMNEQEAESIAGMRNVDEEVLRILGSRRDWISKYNIMLTLCRNPKAPVGVVLPFINRLTLRDLKGLRDDKGVQAVIRETAKKIYLSRTQKT
jgi:hypothetical protein